MEQLDDNFRIKTPREKFEGSTFYTFQILQEVIKQKELKDGFDVAYKRMNKILPLDDATRIKLRDFGNELEIMEAQTLGRLAAAISLRSEHKNDLIDDMSGGARENANETKEVKLEVVK